MPKKNLEIATEVGQRIYRRRKALKWKQHELASRAGLSLQFIACVERGEKGLGYESIIKVCQALEITADYLLTGTATPTESNYLQELFAIMDEKQRQATIGIIENILLVCGYRLPEKQTMSCLKKKQGGEQNEQSDWKRSGGQ